MISPRKVTKWVSMHPFECRACKEAGHPGEPRDFYEISSEDRRIFLFLCGHCDSMTIETMNLPSELRSPRRLEIPPGEADMGQRLAILEATCVMADEYLRHLVKGMRQSNSEPKGEEGTK